MIIKENKWYKLRNNIVVGPIVRINDNCYDFWCPAANFMSWKAGGIVSISGWGESDHDAVEEIPEHRFEGFNHVFTTVKTEFNSWLIASIVCGMVNMNCEKKIEERHVLKHLIKDGGFTAELCKEFDIKFYSVRTKWPESYLMALDCWRVYYDWQCRQAMHGLGGCEKKTFKELINNLNAKRLNN